MKYFAKMVLDAKPVRGPDTALKASNIDGDARIQYRDQSDFEQIARQFGIFQEWKVIFLSLLYPNTCIRIYDLVTPKIDYKKQNLKIKIILQNLS